MDKIAWKFGRRRLCRGKENGRNKLSATGELAALRQYVVSGTCAVPMRFVSQVGGIEAEESKAAAQKKSQSFRKQGICLLPI